MAQMKFAGKTYHILACISYFNVLGLAIFCLSVRFTLQLSEEIRKSA